MTIIVVLVLLGVFIGFLVMYEHSPDTPPRKYVDYAAEQERILMMHDRVDRED